MSDAAGPRLVCIGGSAGSIAPLREIVAALPETFPLPIAVVVHRGMPVAPPGPVATPTLVSVLRGCGRLAAAEVEDLDCARPGCIHVAPAGYHMLVGTEGFALSVDPPENYSMPSIDVLFESAADAYGAGVVGVVLSCANTDGVRGARAIKAAGGTVIAQDPVTAEHVQLISGVCEKAGADLILAPRHIGSALTDLATG